MKSRGGSLLLLAALVAAFPLVGGASAASAACTCSGPDARDDVKGAFRDADAAFIGEFRGTSDPLADEPEVSRDRTVVNYFAVTEVRKGKLDSFLSVESSASGSDCGLSLSEGEKVGMMLDKIPSGFRATACDMAAPGDMPGGPGFSLGGNAVAAVVAGVMLLGVIVFLALGPGREALRGG